MAKEEYDFRDGIDKTKIVYRDTKLCKPLEVLGYLAWLLLTWGWAAGWFALYFWAWIYKNPVVAFWVFIGCWFAFMIFFLTIAIRNLCKFYEQERIKRDKELEEQREKERIQSEAIKRRQLDHGEQEGELLKQEERLKNTENHELNNGNGDRV